MSTLSATRAARVVVEEIVEHTECLGHRKEVGRPTYKRHEVRKISEKQLELFRKDPTIKTCFTEMQVREEKGLFKQKEHKVFMNYHHKDDAEGCDHFKTVVVKTIQPAQTV